jgi:hypothetical protein
MNATEFFIKSTFLDRNRKLILDDDYIEFDDQDLIAASPTKIYISDIEAFRYGLKWIKGYQFVIGRIYCMDIKSTHGAIIKLRLKSLYGVNKKAIHQKFSTIIDKLYDKYFDSMSMAYLQQFEEGKKIELLGVAFETPGITFINKGVHIPWQEVGSKTYTTYYSLFSKSTPEVYMTFEFVSDWNAGILYSVSRQILLNKGLMQQ